MAPMSCPNCNITIATNPNLRGGSAPLYPTTCPTCGEQIGCSVEDEPQKKSKISLKIKLIIGGITLALIISVLMFVVLMGWGH